MEGGNTSVPNAGTITTDTTKPDSMLCEEQFAETANQTIVPPALDSGGSENSQLPPPSDNYDRAFPFHTFPQEDHPKTPSPLEKDSVPTLQPLHSLTHPTHSRALSQTDELYILPPIRPAPPKEAPPEKKDWSKRADTDLRRTSGSPQQQDKSEYGDEEQIELMRENIQLRKKNTLLMNQNMKLILELKDKEHKIFKQQLLLAKYRKRFIAMFEDSARLYQDSESEEDFMSESEEESTPLPRRSQVTPIHTAVVSATSTAATTPTLLGGGLGLHPATTHRSLTEQFGYMPLPHTPTMNKDNGTNSNKRKRQSGGGGRGRGGVLKKSRGGLLGGESVTPPPMGVMSGTDNFENGNGGGVGAGTSNPSAGVIRQPQPKTDFMATIRHKDFSGIYPPSPPPEEAEEGGYSPDGSHDIGGTVVSGFPVPHSLKERHRKGRKSTLWSPEDDEKFLKAYALYGKSWKLIHTLLPEKTREQVQSHGQYLIRTGKIDDIKKARKGRKLMGRPLVT